MAVHGLFAAAPDPVDGGLDLGRKAFDQLLVGIDQGLLGSNFRLSSVWFKLVQPG